MDKNEILDKIKLKFLKYGGVFDFENDELPYKADFKFYHELITNALRSSYKILPKQPGPIHFAYINNMSLNAVAIKDGDSYYIGINTGVVYLLERLFNSMLCNPKVFTIIGDAKAEKPHSKINISFYKSVALFIDNNLSLDYAKPVGSVRAASAKILTAFALIFQASHEFMHIVNGHLDYLKSINGSQFLEESLAGQDGQKHVLDYLSKQTIEFDADALAASDIVNIGIYYTNYPDLLPEELRLFSDRKGALVGLGIFAAYSVFRLFGDDATDLKPMLSQWYPPFEVRRKITYLTAISLLKFKIESRSLDASTSEIMQTSVLICYREAEKAFYRIDSKSKPFSFKESPIFNSSPTDKVNAHLAALRKHWHIMYPLILPYAYKKLVLPS